MATILKIKYALAKNAVLGFLFLGAGKVVERGFRAWRSAKVWDEVVEVLDECN